MEALSGGSDWRRGTRAEFVVQGLTLPQAAKHFGVELASGSGEGGGGSSGEASSGSSGGAGAMPASVLEARLPPTFPEGQHTGVVMELATATVPAAAEGEAERQVQRGVIKREGRVRSQISFELPAGAVAAAVGDRVDFVIKHVENKAVVVSVEPSTAPPPATLRTARKDAASSSSSSSAAKASFVVQAKGPDERGGVGFLLPRTKPGDEMRALLETLKQLKVAAGAGKSG